jgi:hypothetical protein
VVKGVERSIKNELPEKFALIFDGWSENKTHYTAIFASYMISTGANSTKCKRVLLSFSPFEDETDFSAISLSDHVLHVLNYYGKSLNNVVCLIGDNCSTSIAAVVNQLQGVMIGCYSHKLNLVCQSCSRLQARPLIN